MTFVVWLLSNVCHFISPHLHKNAAVFRKGYGHVSNLKIETRSSIRDRKGFAHKNGEQRTIPFNCERDLYLACFKVARIMYSDSDSDSETGTRRRFLHMGRL